jgi:hypothetical protein
MTLHDIVEAISRRLCHRCAREPLDDGKPGTLFTRELRSRRTWDACERALQCYADCWNPSALCFLRKREGWWVLARLILLAVATWAAGDGWQWIPMLLALGLGADVLLFNTAMVFLPDRRPVSIIRSIAFTMVGYPSLALAFSPFWLWLHDFPSSEPYRPLAAAHRALDATYQSVRTLTTAGPGDAGTLCAGAKGLVIIESFVGIYFLSIILAGYVSWLKGDQTK